MYTNFTEAEKLSFPQNLPVLLFVQANNAATDQWVPEHEKQIKDSTHAEMVLMDAGHYLYRSHPQEISEKIKEFTSVLK
jgi:hypothetical protein